MLFSLSKEGSELWASQKEVMTGAGGEEVLEKLGGGGWGGGRGELPGGNVGLSKPSARG